MIFVTVGSQKFQFNRLLLEMDRLADSHTDLGEIFAQTGYSDYQPKHYAYKAFLDREEFDERESEADIVITHGGTGTIIGAIKKGKKVIAVPRLAKYGEHVDDHQKQLISEFKEQNMICGIDDCCQLEEALEYVKMHEFSTYESNTWKIIEDIDQFIDVNIRVQRRRHFIGQDKYE